MCRRTSNVSHMNTDDESVCAERILIFISKLCYFIGRLSRQLISGKIPKRTFHLLDVLVCGNTLWVYLNYRQVRLWF